MKRLLQLDKAALPKISEGRRARLTDIRPACLRGLSGTVQKPNTTQIRWRFLLDEESTKVLRSDHRNTRYTIPDGVTRYQIPGNGLPAGCLMLTD